MGKKLKRSWILWGEHTVFGPKDRPWCYILPADGNRPMWIDRGGFVEADTDDELRELLHKKVDEWFDHKEHMVGLDEFAKDRDANRAKKNRELSRVDSIEIEGFGSPTPKPKIKSDDFIDLMDIGNDIGSSS